MKLDGIEYHNELFPGIWQHKKIKFLVKDHLLKIAKFFIEDLEIPNFTYHDIVITGSITNYNWTESSDIDLHIVIDFDEFDDDQKLLQAYFDSQKSLWKKKHNIMIKGHPVEVYIEDINEPHVMDSGRFSIHFNKWLVQPIHHKFDDSDATVAKKIVDKLNQLHAVLSEGRYSDLEHFLSTIYTMRKDGLDECGEFSPENLAFKILRNKGIIVMINDIMTAFQDKELSLESRRWKK